MRIPRSLQLWPETATVHLFWRCHNKEFYLGDESIKDLYFKCLERSLNYKDQGEDCHIHAFCAMDNHFHQSVSYRNGSANLSKFMRYAHGLFGMHYNKRNDRSGKVAEGRPKTPRIQNDFHAMQAQFYIEANPIRAGIHTEETLKLSPYSSYGFYAYGRKSRFTKLLTIPDWYQRLGKTSRERQRKYRKLFLDYIQQTENEVISKFFRMLIGDDLWLDEAIQVIKEKCRPQLCLNGELIQSQDPPSS